MEFINQIMLHPLWSIYLLGCIVTFIYTIITEREELKKPDAEIGMIVPVMIFSWISLGFMIYNNYIKKHSK